MQKEKIRVYISYFHKSSPAPSTILPQCLVRHFKHCSQKELAAAELAAKEAEFKIVQEEIKQKEKIREMEEQYRRELEVGNSELKRLEAEKEMIAANAKYMIYDREIKRNMDNQQIAAAKHAIQS